MDEPLVEMVTGKPRRRLAPLVADYSGYRIEGAPPGVHRGLPARHLTVIVTLAGTVDLAAMPDSTQPPASFTTLASGLPATPALISHDGRQHGIHLHLTPLGARILLGMPAGELADTVVKLGTLLGPVAGELVERLRSARTWTDRFLELDAGLARIAHRLLKAPHRSSLADVAVRAGFYDQAHLHREWRELAGCTPTRWLADEFPSVQDHRLMNGASSMA